MLGAVQAQGAAAEEPADDQQRRQDPGRQLEPAGKHDKREGEQQREQEHETLARAGDAASARKRRERRGQLQ